MIAPLTCLGQDASFISGDRDSNFTLTNFLTLHCQHRLTLDQREDEVASLIPNARSTAVVSRWRVA